MAAHDEFRRRALDARGLIDLLVGGAGMRRGSRDPDLLVVGDTLDCWRVVAFENDRSLRLAAEMRLPRRAWLEFEVTPNGEESRIQPTAVFEPSGPAGLMYWYGVYPLHVLVFRGMLRGDRPARASIYKLSGAATDVGLACSGLEPGGLKWLEAVS